MSVATRRGFLRGALAAGATGLLAGCRETEIGPANEDELVSLLATARGVIRPVGAGHSFSALVPSDDTLVAADLMNGVIRTDPARLQAEVFAGTRLHRLGPALAAAGQAMPNLPDIDYQTLGGAVATSTHGTGAAFGSLSSEVVGLVLATPGGELLACDREQNAELFHAARCSLGSLGVVSRMTLQNQAPLRMRETARIDDLDAVLDSVEQRRDEHRHFEFYAFPHTRAALTLATDPVADDAPAQHDPTPGDIDQLRDSFGLVGGVPGIGDWLYERLVRFGVSTEPIHHTGPSHEVLAHVRLARFREMEYTVPAEAGPDCLREILGTIAARHIPVVFPIEYRYTKRDDVWLSMFHQRDGCSISLHQYADRDHAPYFDAIEPIFWKYEGRPHWGKLHSLGADALARLYPRWRDFREVREGMDPAGRLLNGHLEHLLGARRRA